MVLRDSLCQKIEDCSKLTIVELEKGLQKRVEEEVKSRCLEKSKTSRVYLLKGNTVELIKKNYMECHKEMLKLSCENLRSGHLSGIPACENVKKIQKGTQL